jgi:hypothetical protein
LARILDKESAEILCPGAVCVEFCDSCFASETGISLTDDGTTGSFCCGIISFGFSITASAAFGCCTSTME